jgi:hypothetical protein
MVAKWFRDQNRDMQQFSWNLDNFIFGLGFEPPINCKFVTLPLGYTVVWEGEVLEFFSKILIFTLKIKFLRLGKVPLLPHNYGTEYHNEILGPFLP